MLRNLISLLGANFQVNEGNERPITFFSLTSPIDLSTCGSTTAHTTARTVADKTIEATKWSNCENDSAKRVCIFAPLTKAAENPLNV